MTSQETTIYKEIQKNTKMAMKAIDAISSKVHNHGLAHQIARQSAKYAELYNGATKELIKANEKSYYSSAFNEMMLRMGVNCNTMMNQTTSHIAELMIKGSNSGILEMEKILRHNKEAGSAPVDMAKQLIDFETNNVKRLKEYL